MIKISKTVLVIIDVQGKLATLIDKPTQTLLNLRILIQGAQILGVPILWTEHVPEKIGATIPEIAQLLSEQKPILKDTFSCWANPAFQKRIRSLKPSTVVIAGIETHVCVYQTAADLLNEKFKVQIVADAVSSRQPENKQIALTRLTQLGAEMTSVEMFLMELLHSAKHKHFRDILKLMK